MQSFIQSGVQPPHSRTAGRLFALDVLRGLAAILVLFRHMPFSASEAETSAVETVLAAMRAIGWMGVDLFFVLSGFLISGLLFKEYDRDRSLNLPRFWWRRGLKIWPSYFAAYGLLVFIPVMAAVWAGQSIPWQPLRDALPNICFVQNYCADSVRWPHSWSLAVEEHFYLGLPLLLCALAWWNARTYHDRPFRGLAWCGLTIFLTVLAMRIWAVRHGKDWRDLYPPTHLRIDSLFFGVLLGYWNRYHRDQLLRLARFWPAILLLALISMALPLWIPLESTRFMPSVGFTLLYVCFGGLVAVASAYPGFGSQGMGPLGWTLRLFAFVGVYSYTIYLAHSVVNWLQNERKAGDLAILQGEVWLDRAFFLGLSLGAGILLSHLVERPILRWRDRRFPSRSGTRLTERTPETSACVRQSSV